MKSRHKKLALIGGALAILGIIAALVLNALNSNIALYISPTDVAEGKAPQGKAFRIGGLVKEGSLKRQADGVTIAFVVTDTARTSRSTTRASFPTCSRKARASSPRAR
jgi:cytochrome c-type biogenesis protein CcmE